MCVLYLVVWYNGIEYDTWMRMRCGQVQEFRSLDTSHQSYLLHSQNAESSNFTGAYRRRGCTASTTQASDILNTISLLVSNTIYKTFKNTILKIV
jgi:hypothetical protein